MINPLLHQILMVALMVFGFGFVVFFHELGHFLAAKWVGIRVEQFAVGFGHALFAWRKGIGWKVGTTNKELRRRCEEHLAKTEKDQAAAEYTDEQINKAADELGLGDTEYRLNWMPLGGYVKMLGQDDLKANAGTEDPTAYNRKGIGERMVVVSAGVIMNIILAAIGFMVVFLIGLKAPAPVVGSLLAGSPAQRAGLRPGDKILKIDGVVQHDFAKIALNTALLHETESVPVEYERPGVAGVQHTTIRPERMEPSSKAFLSLGIRQDEELAGVDPAEMTPEEFKKLEDKSSFSPERTRIRPGDVIVAVNGKPIAPPNLNDDPGSGQQYLLMLALQDSNGEPVPVTVKNAAGQLREEKVTPFFDPPFEIGKDVDFAGMQPRPTVFEVPSDTSVKDKLLPGDVILAMRLTDLRNHPDVSLLKKWSDEAYKSGKPLTIYVLRDGRVKTVEEIMPKTKTGEDRRGLGIHLSSDSSPVISVVADNSPAKKAGIPDGARITAIDGEPVQNWFQVRQILDRAEGNHKVESLSPDAANLGGYEKNPQAYTVVLTATDVQNLKNLRVGHELQLHDHSLIRHTRSPLTAIHWGVAETGYLVLQFYDTIHRMFQGSISASNMMGPIGIVHSGAHFAFKGTAWLIWFLAMISANLAVVNFLPIPIVDGGLFTFLVLEKIQGKPLSPKVMAVAQIVGFALIISVFLLVTFQDLKRTIGF